MAPEIDPNINPVIWAAIEEKRLLQFRYKNRERIIEPHDYGPTRKDEVNPCTVCCRVVKRPCAKSTFVRRTCAIAREPWSVAQHPQIRLQRFCGSRGILPHLIENSGRAAGI